MDKNAIKKYAVWARRELISRVSQKALQYGITEDSMEPASATSVNGVVLTGSEIKQRKALIEKVEKEGYQQVMEEVAYTWFNRFSALRFMEVNGYLPSHVRVFTDDENNFKPQILAEAINLELDGLDMEKIYALKDANDNEMLFKYLIITQCNALSPIMPRMFQRIADYTELLFPDNLLREGSAIQQMIELIPEEDWKDAVQIIGWLYQYYNSEKKDEVFAALKKNVKITKENIPAVTQLFTPDWIVRYMVENSLGRLWVEGHPNEELKSQWKYYLEEAEQEADVQVQLAEIRKEYATLTPEQIKCIDPCAGSGHILAYLFDVLVQIYEAYGYTAREAVRSIVEHNIYGLDIDERAAQLAYFSVMMKARQYDRRFLTRKDEDDNPDVPQPHVYAIAESNGIDQYALDYFVKGDLKLKEAIDSIVKEMHDAKEYGSILNITPVDFAALYARFDEVREDISMSRETVLNELLPVVQVAEMLAQKYDVVVTNPPYMGSSGMSGKLADYVKKNYPDSKSDLFAVFIEHCGQMTAKNRYQAMITQHAWMFLSSFEKLRAKLLTVDIINMAHLGARAFEEIGGEVVQTTSFVQCKWLISEYKGTYCRLVEPTTQQGKEDMFLAHEKNYVAKQSQFFNIPGSPVAYWASESIIEAFEQKKLLDIGQIAQGLITGDTNRFTRLWHEVSKEKFCFDASDAEKVTKMKAKWVPYNKGGEFRKWYGNNDYIVNWENDGFEIKHFVDEKGKLRSRPQGMSFYFKDVITWTKISSSKIGFRHKPIGHISSEAGMTISVPDKLKKYVMGFCNSKITSCILQMLSPTMNFELGDIGKLPIIIAEDRLANISECVTDIEKMSKDDWDSFETSWDFKRHPLLNYGVSIYSGLSDGKNPATSYLAVEKDDTKFRIYEKNTPQAYTIHSAFEMWETVCNNRFNQLKANEEELNRIFIDIYGLQDELMPEVDDKDVTVRKADLQRDIKSLISYAVGCMFGRYSLDVDGLAYAGGEWDASKYSTIIPDKDNIIPICDDEYFEDDMTGRFIKWVETVYGSETLEENLKFIADALGGKGQPKEVIRKYFMDDFYADHCKIYQKRPIYWLFDSGKKGGFRALIYMHRYQPDTIARMRTDYVHEQQSRYRTAIEDLENRIAAASTSERVKLNKRLKTLQDQAAEIQGYEEKIHHLADQYISIDLDDGVKKNYEIFKDVLAKIK